MDRCDDSHSAKTTRTFQYVHSPNAPHQLGPEIAVKASEWISIVLAFSPLASINSLQEVSTRKAKVCITRGDERQFRFGLLIGF
jgi:hypothetical protein